MRFESVRRVAWGKTHGYLTCGFEGARADSTRRMDGA
jgi:hypothetical protein